MYVGHHRYERAFEFGDLVLLRLKPCKQSSLNGSGAKKLKPQFYGPYNIIRRIGEVAYELELLENNQIHNFFHVPFLKKVLGQHITPCPELPPLDDEGKLILKPEVTIDMREKS